MSQKVSPLVVIVVIVLVVAGAFIALTEGSDRTADQSGVDATIKSGTINQATGVVPGTPAVSR